VNDVVVFITSDEPMADMAIGLLKSEGIFAYKRGAELRSSLVLTVDGLGKIEVLVEPENEVIAREVLAARFSESETNETSEDK